MDITKHPPPHHYLADSIYYYKPSVSPSTTDFETFLCRLESLVTACRAPELTIRVVAERKRKYVKVRRRFNSSYHLLVSKVFSNDFVKKLTVAAPCDFNVHLKMSQLEEVAVDFPNPNQCNLSRFLT